MSSLMSISTSSSASSVREVHSPILSSPSTAATEEVAAFSSLIPVFFLDNTCPCVRSDRETPYGEEVEFPDVPGVVGKVGTYDSIVSTSSLYSLSVECDFPSSALLLQPRPGDRACRPPRGYVTVYIDQFKSGLRIPFPPIYGEIHETFDLSPAQISPNSIHQITGLGVVCTRLNVSYSAETVGSMMSFKDRKEGWYYSASRYKFSLSVPSKIPNWQKKFFYCRFEGVSRPDFAKDS